MVAGHVPPAGAEQIFAVSPLAPARRVTRSCTDWRESHLNQMERRPEAAFRCCYPLTEGIHHVSTSIFFRRLRASSLFGIVTVRTPFLKHAFACSSTIPSGSGTTR